MRVLLLSIAVVDDLLAIALIAVVFTAGISAGWLAAGLAVCGAYVAAFRYRLDRGWLLWLLAIACWICIHASGVHATVAGILLGLLTPVRPRAGETTGPSERIQHRLHPVSAAVCVPVFALAATGIGYIVSLSSHASPSTTSRTRSKAAAAVLAASVLASCLAVALLRRRR